MIDLGFCLRSVLISLANVNLLFFLQPDTVTGDIVFVLQQKEHPKFKRKGDDLFVEHTLSLTEALCGYQFVLTHLDGRHLLIKSNPGEVIKPGMMIINICFDCLFQRRLMYFHNSNPNVLVRLCRSI